MKKQQARSAYKKLFYCILAFSFAATSLQASSLNSLEQEYIYACNREDMKVMKKALKAGVNPDLRTISTTPLMRAIESNKTAIIELLLQFNPNLNLQNKYGNSALMLAA